MYEVGEEEIVANLSNLGVGHFPMNSPEHDCAAQLIYALPDAGVADRFSARTGGIVAGKTGRHTFVNWDQILTQPGAHHVASTP